jgi:capsid protein
MELTPFQRLFPRIAMRHTMAQKQLALALDTRYYEGAKKTKFRKPASPDVGAQALTQQGARELRRYARQLDENHDLAIGVLDALVNNVVGMGLPIQPATKTRSGELHTGNRWHNAPGSTPTPAGARLAARRRGFS